ncbi:squalene--hopene cyclase [Frankia sp. Ag45/Mut15]|uniref:Squalene--hopene cyclase n=1 Tax=Frankia umida TaxID=573489 RepID=A0ABT0JUF8_9ACTN|nr:squalene--hopene cyclase [Frankia umida]MCK9874989.1 squalene--hopene cyclase [Frankia umida]
MASPETTGTAITPIPEQGRAHAMPAPARPSAEPPADAMPAHDAMLAAEDASVRAEMEHGGSARRAPANTLGQTLQRGVEHLLSLQDKAGWWKFDLESNTTMDAEDLLLREFLGIRTEAATEASARFIRSRQRPDGAWPLFYGGPGDLSATLESYIGLRLAGDDLDAEHMRLAGAWIRAHGGIPQTRVFTRIWLALFGWWRWEDLPVIPPEIMFLPPTAPLNIYSFSTWARQTIVPLTIVQALRPVHPAPFSLDELDVPAEDAAGVRTSADADAGAGAGDKADTDAVAVAVADEVVVKGTVTNAAGTPVRQRRDGGWAAKLRARVGWREVFVGVDKALHRYHSMPVRPLRTQAIRAAERWIVTRQEADGCFGGIQPPAVYSIIALHLLGYSLDHPVLTAALQALEDYSVTMPDGARMVEASQSPIWDTALAGIALAEAGETAGIAGDHPALLRTADYLLGQEIRDKRGDWAVNHPDLEPSGWAFEFENDTYPDTDDTAAVLLALRKVRHPRSRELKASMERGITWLFGMQSSDGGWGAYDSDNTSTLVYEIPFGDFGALTDPPSADVTAHVVELLAEEGLADDPRTRRGVQWLLDAQETDGSWFGRWGVNYVYGTGNVLPALRAAGVAPSDPVMRAGADWLLAHQNADGGWGEDVRSYDDRDWAGRGETTASQTAWGMLGLLATDRRPEVVEALARGARWLAENQLPNGTWDEPHFTGTGFPGDFYLNYYGYRLLWPVMALGRYLRECG